MSRKRRIILGILCICLLTLPVYAASASGSVTVAFLPNVRFHLYHIATVSDGIFCLTSDFSAFSLPTCSEFSEQWRTLAAALSDHVNAAGLPALKSATTGKDGHAVFVGLPNGLYLVTADPFFMNGRLCIPPASILQLQADPITVYPKYIPIPEEEPNTGDTAALELWVFFSAVSVLAMGILFMKRNRFLTDT